MQPLPPPVQLVETSEDELKQYDGTDPKKSLLMANKGQIYDVSQSRRNYDVFLSFRGTDVRNNFVGHLYTALDQRGMNTYFDREELKKGEQISAALMEAIEDSRIAIVVFSENYASSTWCLDELAKIMECKKQRDLIVFPVFYKVEPREVRTPRNNQSYAQALAEHEVKFKKDPEKVKKWKQALYEAGSLSGQPIPENACEAGLIQHIVQEISAQLDRTPLYIAKYPVGIDSQVQKLQKILNLQSKDDVLMVGLWGQGGVGKTTLAKAINNAVFREFQGSSFLENIRENSKNFNDLVLLQEKMLSEVLPGKEFTVFSVAKGSQLIQYRLCKKKVLVILDDVDDERQLNALAGNCDWFGKGSRIIFTTRDKHLLTSHGVDSNHMYEVEALKDGEALELFRKHAFQRNQEMKISSNLVDRVLHYAGGLPLALEVLGCFLCGRGEQEWKCTLQKLSRTPDKKINDVLKVSYDGLEDYVKEIFLDIACFFKGQKTKYVMKVLDSCHRYTTIGVQILIERSLISENGRTLQMHDLIELMGMEIVKEECRDDARKRSRLWLYDDVLDVLSGVGGTNAIKAMVLKLPKPKETYICPDAFTNMRNLRLLILHNVGNSFQGPVHLPSQLGCLELHNCALIPEVGYGRKRLVRRDMLSSKIKELPKFKVYIQLKFINFSGHRSLVCMPDLNGTPNLEVLNLRGCKKLERAHESVSYHKKLQFLNLGGCSKLHHLPDVLQSKNLRILNLDNCSKLQRLPDFSDEMKGLRGLSLQGTSIEKLPASIGNLVSLGKMNLVDCKKLTILPSSIYRLSNLEFLRLEGCSKLVKFPKWEGDLSDPHMKMGFPKLWWLNLNKCNLSEIEFLENPSCFHSLNYLNLAGNNFTNLPTCEQQYKLPHLPISYCPRIQEILDIPGQFQRQRAIGYEFLREGPSKIWDIDNDDLSSWHEGVHEVLHYNLSMYKGLHGCHGCQELFMPGGEMPKWLLPNDEGHISFMASKELLEKFLGLAFGIVIRVKCGEKKATLVITLAINGEEDEEMMWEILPDFDHVLVRCYEPRLLWNQDSINPNGWNRFMLTIRASHNAIVKTCGFRLICEPLKNDLEIFLQHNQSLDPALLYEVRHEDNQTSTVDESSSKTEDLIDSETSREKNSSSDLVLQGSNVNDFPFQSLDPALRYKVRHEDNQTSTVDESSSETEDLIDSETSREKNSSIDLVLQGSKVTDFLFQRYRYSLISSDCKIVHPGGEMPEEFIPVEDGAICFMASQELYDKLRGLALCVVFGVEDGKKEISFNIVPHVNDKRRNVLSGTLGSFDSDHTWVQGLKSNVLWGLLEGGIDFGEFDENYLRFSLRLEVLGGIVKKLGYMMLTEDD